MTNTQHEQLFTELTPAEAAVIEGGDSVINSTVNFDFALDSRKFSVTAGDPRVTLRVGALTARGDDGLFRATLKRVLPGGGTVSVAGATVFGNSLVNFGRQSAGQYLIQFTDKKDGRYVKAPAQIAVF